MVIFNCVALMFIQEGLGIVVNTPCTTDHLGRRRWPHLHLYKPKISNLMDYSIKFLHPRLSKKLEVEIPSNQEFYTLCPREREVKRWGSLGAFRFGRMQSTNTALPTTACEAFTMPRWCGLQLAKVGALIKGFLHPSYTANARREFEA